MSAVGERLWIENGDGAAKAHRVIPCGRARRALIGERVRHAVEVRPVTGFSKQLVPIAELADAAALSAREVAEYRRLDRQLAGTKGDAAKLRRFNALRLRWIEYGAEGEV